MAALSPSCAERLLSSATLVDLPLRTVLYRRDERPRFLYLLTSGIASAIFVAEDGTSIELAAQGNEGLIGWISLLGPTANPSDCGMQVAGAGYRLPFASVQRAFDEDPPLRARLLEYVQHQTIAAHQIVACNRLHRAEARFSRWLLMVSDRLGMNDFSMTQEFMAMMLGARRTTVAEVCGHLVRAGALESRRGGVQIANRPLLEERACECYRILRERFDALYQGPGL